MDSLTTWSKNCICSIMIKIGVVLLALGGAFHCVGMCSPLIAALHAGRSRSWQLLYHGGRIFAYLLLGLLLGSIGMGGALFLTQQQLSVLSGALLLVYVWIEWRGANKAGFRLANFFRELGQRYNKQGGGFFLGIANGLLPCGLVYGAAFLSMAEGDMVRAVSNMFIFGLITTILLLGAHRLWHWLLQRFKQLGSGVLLQRFMMVVLAVFLIVRGLGQGGWWSPAIQMNANAQPVVECK